MEQDDPTRVRPGSASQCVIRLVGALPVEINDEMIAAIGRAWRHIGGLGEGAVVLVKVTSGLVEVPVNAASDPAVRFLDRP